MWMLEERKGVKMGGKFSPSENGLAEKVTFLSKAPFVLNTGGQAIPSAAPGPAPAPGGQPKLDPNFSTEFEREKAAFFSKIGVNVANPTQQHKASWGSSLSLKAATLISEATLEANRWIDLTLPQLPTTGSSGTLNLSPCIDTALLTHFKTGTNAEKIKAIVSIKDFLNKVKSNQYGINSGKVTYVAGGFLCGSGDMGYTGQNVKTETHLCPDLWAEVFQEYPQVTTAARTLIHEGLHRVAWWQFGVIAGIWGTDIPEGEPGYTTISFAKSLENADSYAAFARDAANCAAAMTSATPAPSVGGTPSP